MEREKEWYRLDNAAKMIPSSMAGADTRVFRIVCELKEEVDEATLQQALDLALEEFPYMNCCLRKGIFWYYMDEMDQGAVVHEERKNALSALYVPGKKNLMYRVLYFRNRINLEIYHVLSDGTGGYMFFEQIITNYLILKHNLDRSLLKESRASVTDKQEDAFSQFYEKGKSKKRNFLKEMFPVKAYQVKGLQDPNLNEHLVEGTVSTSKMLEIAHKYNVTLGVLTTSIWIEAILKQMKRSEYNKPIVVSVPVNLRQFFPSETTRNFFGVIVVKYEPKDYDGTLESILPKISEEFKAELQPEKVRATMNSYADLEHNLAVKVVPLFLKDLGMQGIAHMMNNGITTSVSNVGRVKLPEQLEPYINKFSVFMACKTIFMCVSTYQDKLTFGIVSCYEKHPTCRNFFMRLVDLGLEVEISSNDYDEQEGA